jgi:trimethylamine corrinoid protein
MTTVDIIQKDLLNLMLDGDENKAIAISREALDQGISPREFFEKCIAPSLEEVGKRFETLEIFLPEMVTAADVVQRITNEVITPKIEETHAAKITSAGKVLLATVQGDLHDIGKNMVGLMLRANGFDVIDLGINVSPSEIILQAERENVDIIGLSSLLTTCLPYMKDVVDYLNANNNREKYAVIIGGAATTPEFAHHLCTDGIGNSAAEAVTLCQKLMNV